MNDINRLSQILRIMILIIWLTVVSSGFAQQLDTEKTQILRSQLTKELSKISTGQENQGVIRKLRNDLAKTGDALERASIYANMKHNDPYVQFVAIKSAEYVGGDDMICRLAELLSDTNGYRSAQTATRGPQGQPPQDVLVYAPPRIVAARTLANLVENPPVAPIGKRKKLYTEDDVEKWREWWVANSNKYCNSSSNEVSKAKAP